jgi:hypothetical protein
MKALTYALALLAALRATRFITSDTLGEWTIVGPVKRWAHRHESGATEQGQAEDAVLYGQPVPSPDPRNGWRSKMVKGLDCPFCIGFWFTALAVVGAALANRGPRRRAAFQVAAGAFGANYLTGHVSARLDG